ncbi:hypothetical protein SAMN04515691_2963 [Leifsonia sp. 98AMF]|uniref:hypothetical protein n=1 Tax=unclassified Leifsonia TaxID=2663824 RepID=UPI00087D5850|nr:MULTISPECIES: hypothetical protein [unclassified Leifsonia]SDH16637.1 hypothetical protein SAMN04515690_1053 [Leifsonia sp. 197AMF]SDJ21685.1 hypothetical protein SAMN04515684_2729 [Leifsonia sp. 466MF]SDJ43152.1 hypothetical protein SAMN04515683_0014 [Leifsonia sp. 157MF]SDN43349.1 hypothetical protein SAMN04515686_0913 [Leifsonia sp. 509MF]SEM77006.1 hypothetical protein SAMN04515685_0002 [Leifsonia sp. 467MF]
MDFASIILWNKSKLNGARWESCILTLEAGMLELRNDRGLVFRSPASRVTCRFTVLGSLVITLLGAEEPYVLSVYGNWTTPLPTERQLDHLRQIQERLHIAQVRGSVMTGWHRALTLNGGEVVGRKGNGLAFVIAICLISIGASLAFIVAAIVGAI